MDFPLLNDGTVHLRPFAPEDRAVAGEWLSGPTARRRSVTDGGPAVAADAVDRELSDLGKDLCGILELDGTACGLLACDRLRGRCNLRIVLADPAHWHQGIGDRAVRLALALAFDHLKGDEAWVLGVREQSAARIAWEDHGFGMQRRHPSGDEVLIDFALSRRCHQANEQRVYLVRHAQAGPTGSLTALGRVQAEALAACPLLFRVVEAVVGDQPMAMQTAERAFAAREVPCAIDEAWHEQDLGAWKSRPHDALPRTADGLLADPEGGETQAAFSKRLSAALDRLPHGAHLAVVTHGDAIACLLRCLQPALAEASGLRSGAGIAEASVTELRRGPEGWRVIRIADDRHLQGRPATTQLV